MGLPWLKMPNRVSKKKKSEHHLLYKLKFGSVHKLSHKYRASIKNKKPTNFYYTPKVPLSYIFLNLPVFSRNYDKISFSNSVYNFTYHKTVVNKFS